LSRAFERICITDRATPRDRHSNSCQYPLINYLVVDDDVLDFHTTVPVDDHSKTQTLPKSYKTRVKSKDFESNNKVRI
jgi:hypothetical protein